MKSLDCIRHVRCDSPVPSAPPNAVEGRSPPGADLEDQSSTTNLPLGFLSDSDAWETPVEALGPSALAPPKGCVLYPLLFYQYTSSCTSSHQRVKLLKVVGDTTLTGLISGGDEAANRWGSEHLVTWCCQNNLELNALTVETVRFQEEGSATFPHHPV
ncbi:uncharacterized protein AB9W97_014162 isoform 1-T1 [Spinachia spinachia]